MKSKIKKILIVNTYFSLEGGAEVVALRDFSELKKLNYCTEIFATTDRNIIDQKYRYIHYRNPVGD